MVVVHDLQHCDRSRKDCTPNPGEPGLVMLSDLEARVDDHPRAGVDVDVDEAVIVVVPA